ncbi:hypothetical protein CTEN210_12723 [Chaetoceros tenuissimus]|uniref:G-protein coupled receptors family 1 profile domain-containing protein n=1 Tax=Chaetoceros tenuissimus TaxID=426638 RepID=A0AAD3D1Q5_9STRA|nr:hypothetical protein CTEN210_12723 [Chaetoceros tenuissimus]
MILRNENGGLKSPYSRIIFGLSLGDMIYSLGLIFGPIAAPKDTPMKLWARGTVETCEFIGFLFNFMSTVPFYSAFLTYYFYQRVICKVQPDVFAKKYEPYLHVLTWAYPFIGGCVGLTLDMFNPSRRGSMCIMVESPLHCVDDPSMECTRGSQKTTFMVGSIYQILIPFIISFSCVVVNLSRFTLYIYREEKMLNDVTLRNKRRISNDGREIQEQNSENNITNEDEENVLAVEAIEEENKPDDAVPYTLARQALVQSSLYIVAFLLCFTIPLIAGLLRITTGKLPHFFFMLISILSPLGGFLNILIYTRPKIQAVRKLFPQYEDSPWIKVFFLVIINGGEVPDAMEEQQIEDYRMPGTNNQKNINQYEELDELRFSSKENFGRAVSGDDLKSADSYTDRTSAYKNVIVPSMELENVLDKSPRASDFGFTGAYKDVKLPLSRNTLKSNSENILGEESSINDSSCSGQRSSKILNRSLSLGLESIPEENMIDVHENDGQGS